MRRPVPVAGKGAFLDSPTHVGQTRGFVGHCSRCQIKDLHPQRTRHRPTALYVPLQWLLLVCIAAARPRKVARRAECCVLLLSVVFCCFATRTCPNVAFCCLSLFLGVILLSRVTENGSAVP